ncbi:MAG TPA: NAD(P)/FAD-dependent oxidoreductase [Candidatus Limnocylindria bacterium]|nr:NAD(P)/FAD-dependent oxidoreductase [Candidatus Limnocylindria bacterium]
MQTYDLVIIGAGEAGQAAAHLARHRGASVAVVERELFGGSCPYWACMPSKALLHAAAVHAAGGDYAWPRASDFRDWMIKREGTDWPDDSSHVESLEKAGAAVFRGTGQIDGPGRVTVASDGAEQDGDEQQVLGARAILVAVGTHSTVPDDIEGLDQIEPWTNRQATTTRELPRSLVILGGGPTGVEMAQVYARYGVPTVLVSSSERINPSDHPRSSAVLDERLRAEGVDIRTGTRAVAVRARGGAGAAHAVELENGSAVTGHEVLLAVGRTAPLAGLGLETVGVTPDADGRLHPDERLRIAENVYVAGDPAGPEMHTHLAVYQGEIAARIALGEDVRPDHRAIPHAIYTDPQAAGVGLQLDDALAQGLDAFEETADYATTAPGFIAEAAGHVTIVADRGARVLLGAFIAAPGAAEAIGEAVLAVKLRVPLEQLADTIHPFPTTLRIMGSLFAKAAARSTGG